MNTNLEQLLAELYKIDPELRQHDEQVRRAITILLQQKPDTHFDANFAARLREKIITQPKHFSLSAFLSSLSMKPSQILFPSLSIAAIVAIVLISNNSLQTQLANTPTPQSNTQVTTLSEGAFGRLTTTTGAVRDSSASAEATAPSAPSSVAPQPLGLGGGAGITSSGKMMAPDMIMYPQQNYRFTYKGGAFPTISEKMSVLRRVKGSQAVSASGFTSAFSGLIDISKFANLKVQSFSIIQDQPYGYNIYADFNEGVISLSQNYQAWPHPENCLNEQGCNPTLLTQKSIPSNEELINTANAFLDDYGISRGNYGTPQVNQNSDPIGIMRKTDATSMPSYISESISIIYPLMLDGQTAFEEGGQMYGLMVNINIRENRVEGVWNLTSNTYEKSSYASENDTATLKKIAEQGGRYGMYTNPTAETKLISLDTPELVLMHTWLYYDTQSHELLVPALRFPIIQAPENSFMYFNQTAILVPLVKDLLDQKNDYPVPMPLMMDSAPPSATRPLSP